MRKKHPITVAYGDGIGPEIMTATLRILEAAKADIEIEEVVIGEKVYLAGKESGIDETSWESLRRTKVFLKAPITTPQGGGYRSLNVTIRTTLGLYANVRPSVSYHPFIASKHPQMNVVTIRENEEDLYTGIEYRQTPDVTQALKLISRSGSERIIRYAFEYAKHHNRKKVSAFSKDNILKITDGLFHKVFLEIGQDYPQIEKEHLIVDIGAAKLSDAPETFDVIVLPNLYGDILSDVAAQISGSVGICGSANIGEKGAMFEAIHGSAPKRAGQNVANPSGLIHGAILMLLHIHQPKIAEKIQNAWLKTIEEGIHTYDIFSKGKSKEKVGTKEFADAVIARLDQKPLKLKPVEYKEQVQEIPAHYGEAPISTKRELIGVDVYLYSHEPVEHIQGKLLELGVPPLALACITNRGTRVWPSGYPETVCTDHWRCRFLAESSIKPQVIASLLHRLADGEIDVIKTENLYLFDKKPGFSNVEKSVL